MTVHTIKLSAAIKAARKKIRVLSRGPLNSNLNVFCGDFAEAYTQGVEEAQAEILRRLEALAPRTDDQGVKQP